MKQLGIQKKCDHCTSTVKRLEVGQCRVPGQGRMYEQKTELRE